MISNTAKKISRLKSILLEKNHNTPQMLQFSTRKFICSRPQLKNNFWRQSYSKQLKLSKGRPHSWSYYTLDTATKKMAAGNALLRLEKSFLKEVSFLSICLKSLTRYLNQVTLVASKWRVIVAFLGSCAWRRRKFGWRILKINEMETLERAKSPIWEDSKSTQVLSQTSNQCGADSPNTKSSLTADTAQTLNIQYWPITISKNLESPVSIQDIWIHQKTTVIVKANIANFLVS